MFRRSLLRCFVAFVIFGAGLTALTLWAEPIPTTKAPAGPNEVQSKELLEKQRQLFRKYKAIVQDLLVLAHRFEKSPRIEDQEKAKFIRKAIEFSDKEGIENKFITLLRTLEGGITSIGVGQAKNETEDLVRFLRHLLEIPNEGDALNELRREKERLKEILAALNGVIRDSEIIRTKNESGKIESAKLAKEQAKNADNTKKLANRFEGKGTGDGKSEKGTGQPTIPGAEKVRQAAGDQENARQKLEENKPAEAAGKQTDAIDKMKQVADGLKKRLQQLREEELERLLANLEARVAKMLQMQMEVYEATKAIDAIVKKSATKKPEKVDIQRSQIQSDKEADIISEANKAIEILKEEGSAVAFPRVFEETMIDMTRIRERLNQANIGADTQGMEKDVLDSLKEMLDALKKAQRDLQQSNNQPGQGGDGQPPDQKLLDQIAELKMIRSLQAKVNERTKRHATTKINGLAGAVIEQVDDPQIKVELKDLAGRQIKIERMVRDLAAGDGEK